MTEPQPDEVTQRLQHLRGMLADLQDYIERRAEELAGPLIEDAAEKAREMVATAEREAQRWKDANTELGRRLEARQRFEDENRDAVARLAAALGYRHPSGHWLPSLVAEVEARLAKEKTDG